MLKHAKMTANRIAAFLGPKPIVDIRNSPVIYDLSTAHPKRPARQICAEISSTTQTTAAARKSPRVECHVEIADEPLLIQLALNQQTQSTSPRQRDRRQRGESAAGSLSAESIYVFRSCVIALWFFKCRQYFTFSGRHQFPKQRRSSLTVLMRGVLGSVRGSRTPSPSRDGRPPAQPSIFGGGHGSAAHHRVGYAA